MTLPTGGFPFTDVTARMGALARAYAARIGVDPEDVPEAHDVVTLIHDTLPPGEEVPAVEAAAYLGEWLRGRGDATWIAEGHGEPQLQVTDATRAKVHLLPLVSIVRLAVSAGFDGVARLLDTVAADVTDEAHATALLGLPVQPEEERADVVAWVHAHRALHDATRASLWRRCASCSSRHEQSVTLHHAGGDWDSEAATAAAILVQRPWRCACGGAPGQTSRFLMLRETGDGRRLGDIHVQGGHTRVSCWELQGDTAVPCDALALPVEGMTAG